MTWEVNNVIEQREKFIKAWYSGQLTKTELCKRFNISRPTGDKWIKRHFEGGTAALADMSKAPHRQARATPVELCEMLIQAKRERPHWGAKKLLNLLRRENPELKLPADSTGDLILKRAGLVKPRRYHRTTPADSLPFSDCTGANQCWSVDFKGDFAMGNGKRCYPLTITDNYSRYLFRCTGFNSTQRIGVQQCFEQVFREYGLPTAIRSDNGSPFASTALGGLSKLSKWWIDLGIIPQRIKVGKPQQNGRHERMHRSLKEYLERLDVIEQNLEKQQQRFDEFVKEYNELRSHESIDNQTPISLYMPSSRQFPNKIATYDYDDTMEIRKVKANGEIKWQGNRYYLSQVLAGEYVGFLPCSCDEWRIYYRFHQLGLMNDSDRKIYPLTQWHTQGEV